ncbi:MAG: 2Fe-2S iron-sulfur cluster-binding protein, partial [Chloroflexota bacterium]
MTDTATANASKITIEFRSHDKVTRVPPGMSIFNAASWIGLPIDSTCGARGTCGKCKIRIVKGQSSITAADRHVFSEEELAQGWRLSCRAEAHDDVVCEVPRLMGNPKAALMGFGRHVILDPNVHKVTLQLAAPSLEDQRSDAARVRQALSAEGFDVTIPLSVLRRLPRVLRESNNWQVTAVVVGQELVSVEPGDTSGRNYGLAFDIGTTTVVGMLMDLNSGAPAAVHSTLNGQAVFGADVISRISHTMMNEEGLQELQDSILTSLNDLIASLLGEAGVAGDEVYE